MKQDPLEKPQLYKERFDIKIRLATAEDWQAYKDLRLEAINGPDALMMGFVPKSERDDAKREMEINKTEADWRKDLSREDTFCVLFFSGTRAVGMGWAKKNKREGNWQMFSGYLKKEFRDSNIGKKIFATRLKEIMVRGGRRVTLAVKADNNISIHIAESFGFKRVGENNDTFGFFMTLEDVNNPETIQKIDEVLNAK